MLKRIMVSIALASLSSEIAAQDYGASSARPEVAANVQAQAQESRAQTQASEQAAQEAAAGEKAPAKPKAKKGEFIAGPYFGFSVGPRTTYTGTPAVNKGFAGIASAGVATMFTEKMYFAGEIFIYDNLNLRNFPNGISNVKSSWTYGLDIIPGWMIFECVLGYLRLGASSTEYRNREIEGLMAWRIGIGAQANISGGWDIRTEYIYNNYKRVSIGKPQTDQFNLGVVYKFL